MMAGGFQPLKVWVEALGPKSQVATAFPPFELWFWKLITFSSKHTFPFQLKAQFTGLYNSYTTSAVSVQGHPGFRLVYDFRTTPFNTDDSDWTVEIQDNTGAWHGEVKKTISLLHFAILAAKELNLILPIDSILYVKPKLKPGKRDSAQWTGPW